MAAGKPGQALETLEDIARRVPPRAYLYRLLSDAAGKSGRRAASHRYRAEQLYAAGDLEPAIHQLEIALRQRDSDFHEASRIEVRLETLREEQRELKKNEGLLKGSR
jgi:beta-barrel assembly-enhancing protease